MGFVKGQTVSFTVNGVENSEGEFSDAQVVVNLLFESGIEFHAESMANGCVCFTVSNFSWTTHMEGVLEEIGYWWPGRETAII